MRELRARLEDFKTRWNFVHKGPLCVALVVTQHAREKGLPLNPDNLLTERGGQVRGLSRTRVQSVLARHGIKRVLASEGGRTSRGSLHHMRAYVQFLNELHEAGLADLDAVEVFWIEQVRAFFSAQPFKLKLDPGISLRTLVRDVIEQAEERQRGSSGTQYVGAVLQHLVGAKLDIALGGGAIEHKGFSTADEQLGRAGDFVTGDAVIHVTSAPGEAIIERCRENINAGKRPIIVTTSSRMAVAEGLAENAGLRDRIDMFDIEQFIALNIYEWGRFCSRSQEHIVREFVSRYNEIVEEAETDPSIKIEIRG